MIAEITIENISKLDNSFLKKEYILNELTNNPYAKIKILEMQGEIVGYIYYSDIYDRAEINQIEVKENCRNQGYGNLLLNDVIESLKKDITLEVNKNNYSAIRLYKKNKFKNVAIRKGYYNGIDAILMEMKYK